MTALDEKALEAAWAALVGGDIAATCYQASIVPGDLRAIIQGYLTALPQSPVGGGGGLVERLQEQSKPGGVVRVCPEMTGTLVQLCADAATALLSLQAENERLKDLADSVVFHQLCCLGGCHESMKALALLAKAIGFKADPATMEEIEEAAKAPSEKGETHDCYAERISEQRAESKAEGFVMVPVDGLLAVRDALVKSNVDEAYHQLYALASPNFDKFEPWEEWESIASNKLVKVEILGKAK